MTPLELAQSDSSQARRSPPPAWLFFLRWLANPVAMGSVTPSAPSLCRLIARHVVRGPDEVVVEYGGGTGVITRALLDAGIPPNRLYVLERDPELADYLCRQLPGVTVINGDCRDVDTLIAPEHVGKVGTVVCGIPMVLLPVDAQREILDATWRVMPEGRRMLLYTYCLTSPLPLKPLGVKGQRLGWTPLNVPPAMVWGFRPKA